MEFSWVHGPLGRVLRAPTLAPMADAWFTTRDLSLAGTKEETSAGWDALAEACGVDRDHLVRLVQVHGAAVHVSRRGSGAAAGRPTADAVVTDDPSVALAVQVADCVPVLVADKEGHAVAAVHAGWRGIVAGVVISALGVLDAQFGVPAGRLVAGIGPSIGPCCYQVGEEVELAYARAGYDSTRRQPWFIRDGASRPRLDLWAAVHDQLVAAGVPAAAVHIARLCTACEPSLFYSYRRDGAGAGRMAGVIRLRSR